MNDEQRDNRLRLADGLEKVAEEWPEHFDMDSFVRRSDEANSMFSLACWADGESIGDPRIRLHNLGKHPMECGTVACAIGWAPYILGIPMDYEGRTPWVEYSHQVLGTTNMEFQDMFLDFSRENAYDPLPVATKLRMSVDSNNDDRHRQERET